MKKFPEMDEKFEQYRRAWYQNDDVLYNIIDALKYRETVFLRKGCVHRCLKTNAIRYLKMNFERYHFYKEPFNLYGSLGIFPDLPMFSFNRKEKRQQMDEFNLSYSQYMKGYDFLFDVDNPKITSALSTTRKIKKIFDDYRVPYWIQFSGTKGFHIRVDSVDFPNFGAEAKDFNELAILFKKFADNFARINNLPDVDTSIFDLRRIAKTPYSISYPYYLVSMPLSDDQIRDFDLEMCTLPYLLKNTELLRNRKVLKRNGTHQGFYKLIKEYTVW